MIISLNNRELIFDNIELKNDCVYLRNNFQSGLFLRSCQLKYNEFIELLKTSLDNYVECIDKNKTFETVEQYFNYFKITTNPLVKRNMATKIGNIILNDISLKDDDEIKKLINSHKINKNDPYYNFIKIVLNIKYIKVPNKDSYQSFDDEYFTMIDFILDYYSE